MLGVTIAAALAAALVACGSSDSPATSATTAAAAASGPLTLSIRESALGSYLAAPDGRTLYVFTKDAPNRSNCSAGCLAVWPPLMLPVYQEVNADAAATGKFGSIEIANGRQVTYNGAPLYLYANDAKAGDTTGHRVGGIWFVARPDTASTAVLGVHTGGAKAPYLVGPDGLTLYLYAKDAAGTSTCSGGCAAAWPPLTLPEGMEPTAVEAAQGERGLITRDDGTRQLTYRGLPLYRWNGDMKPGDTTGDGVGGVWSLAKP